MKTRAEEEAEFEKDVQELAEGMTGLKGCFSWMAWEAGDETGRQAVVWMRGKFEAGRCYTVRQEGKSGVVMRVVEETGVDVEMRNTGAAVALVQNVSAGAVEDMCAGSRTVAAKKAKLEK